MIIYKKYWMNKMTKDQMFMVAIGFLISIIGVLAKRLISVESELKARVAQILQYAERFQNGEKEMLKKLVAMLEEQAAKKRRK